MSNDIHQYSLEQLHAIFKLNRRAATKLAEELGLHVQNIYNCYMGRGNSKRVEEAVRRRAAELVTQCASEEMMIWNTTEFNTGASK